MCSIYTILKIYVKLIRCIFFYDYVLLLAADTVITRINFNDAYLHKFTTAIVLIDKHLLLKLHNIVYLE